MYDPIIAEHPNDDNRKGVISNIVIVDNKTLVNNAEITIGTYVYTSSRDTREHYHFLIIGTMKHEIKHIIRKFIDEWSSIIVIDGSVYVVDADLDTSYFTKIILNYNSTNRTTFKLLGVKVGNNSSYETGCVGLSAVMWKDKQVDEFIALSEHTFPITSEYAMEL